MMKSNIHNVQNGSESWVTVKLKVDWMEKRSSSHYGYKIEVRMLSITFRQRHNGYSFTN